MRTFILLSFLLTSINGFAEIISVRVTGVIERASTLVPDVPVGSAFDITISYSDALPDLNPQVAVGEYNLVDPAMAIHGHINNFEFRNRNTPQLEIRLPPAVFRTPTVNVTVRNFGNNLYVPNPPAGTGLDYVPLHMNWALSVPPGSTFFSNDSLPAIWPTLTDLESTGGVPHISIGWQVQIGSELDQLNGQVLAISSGSPVPLPGALVLLLAPLLMLGRRRQK